MNNSKSHLLRNMAAVSLLCAGFVSCSQDDFADTQGEPLPQGEYPLELTAGGLQALSAPASAPSARGTADDNWDGVQSLAVQVGGVVKEYTVTSPNNESTATLTSDEPFYWQTTEEVLNITAWYPYSEIYPESWEVKADQNVAANYQASDLIKGELTLAFADRNNPEKNKLSFEHQMAKIAINLTLKNGAVTLGENVSVKLHDVSGVAGGGTDITCYRPSSDQQTYYAILPPQTILGGMRFIQVSVDGNDFSYIPIQIRVLKPGKIYTYNVTLNANGIVVSEVSGATWTDGGSEKILSTDNTQE